MHGERDLVPWVCASSAGRQPGSPGQDHPPISQIPALLDHVQNVGLSAGAGQTGKEEDRRPGGRVRMREAVVVVKPIQRDLSSICCLNKLTAERSGTRNSATRIPLNIINYLYLCISIYLSHSNTCKQSSAHTGQQGWGKRLKINIRFVLVVIKS